MRLLATTPVPSAGGEVPAHPVKALSREGEANKEHIRGADIHVSHLSRENDEALVRALESARCD